MLMANEHKQTILVVDDAKENIVVLSRLLKSQANILFATNGQDGLQKSKLEQPDLILLDISMPDLNGFEVLSRLKKSTLTAGIPVIFITGIPDSKTEELGLNCGAVDYIIKPFAPAVVQARVRHQLRIQRLTSALKEANTHLTLLAMTDPLTNAYNRRYFFEALEKELYRAARHHLYTSLVTMDIDKFKLINDSYGHDVGDKVIIEITRISATILRKNDIFGRLGGEEFVILLPDTLLKEATQIANRLCHEITQASIKVDDKEITFTVSCGVTESIIGDDSPEQFVKRADLALYKAKRTGRNKVVPFCADKIQDIKD